MKILVVRHGQPFDESETGGHGDPPLSELGLRQAQAIGDHLASEKIDHIVASPMVRAHQTALPLCAHLGLEPELDDDLKEAGWQAGAYMRSEENMSHFVEKLNNDPEYLFRPEGRDVFTERVMRAFTKVRDNNPGKTVAVFCHGMVTTAFASTILGVDFGPGDLAPDYTGLMQVKASQRLDMWTMQSFNETMHLQAIAD
jgi:probable phosphoglycerate mutase